VIGFFAAIGVTLPDRGGEEAEVRCFAAPGQHAREDRNASCSVNLLTGLWKCHGCGEQGNAYQAALKLGYAEQAARELAQRHGVFLEREREKLPGFRQLKKWREALFEARWGDETLLDRLEARKGWTPHAIWRCGLGWDGERITFPIKDHRLRIVGLVRYLPGGSPKSKAVPGSRRLLFPPPETIGRTQTVFVVEGEPDAVSVRSCGFPAVAVPGAQSWRYEFVGRLAKFPRIVVIADCDRQGRELAQRIVADCGKRAVLLDLEPSRTDGYDFGDLLVECRNDGGAWQARRLLETWSKA
jgi:hypothetical protein